ncbi:Homeo [Glarea lozoyensis ATCC 20868]|uniref:Homeo n=1 Tax=Glarea lozoyensis (strain ATCC 20868 / MF5171) TaxID=1116229 RepID=S3D0U3_GLAL2|nr:Homeo [Glarea lozoyensis ATCC 20868]EPE25651.1 Homeo [Glarea lozoyensis ATCC 20868]
METPDVKPNFFVHDATPYQAAAASMYATQPVEKRQRTPDREQDTSSKRQKIENPSEHADFDLEALLAQATAGATLPSASRNDHHVPKPPSPIPQRRESIPTPAESTPYDPSLYMWVLSLPLLENLSIQLLSILAQTPYSETINNISTIESDHGQAFATLKSLFSKTKEIYSKENVFLSADELGFTDVKQRSIIRNTNMATFVAGVFGGQDVGFYELNHWFLNTFTPENETMDANACNLCTNLKTQMYLSALGEEDNEKTKEEILEDLFPSDLSSILLARHPGVQLSDSETKFVSDCRARKEYLLSVPADADSIQTLSEQYPWEDFLSDLSTHINQQYEGLLGPYMQKHDLPTPVGPIKPGNKPVESIEGTQDSSLVNNSLMASADLAAQEALLSISAGHVASQNEDVQQPPQQSTTPNQSFPPQYGSGNIPYHTQSAPTQVLYNLARQAAVAKSNPGNSRQPGPPSQRRPWTTEEENALMAGLDRVKGPHWSQILALYGDKGTINDILADRSQVQLKDKARNLKLFFLKSRIEVPYYLQSVTGELKTRAPSQAARKEAEEKAASEKLDEQAHFNGMMTLGVADHHDPINHNAGESPEQFHVTEPVAPNPPQVSDDVNLAQQLLASEG